MIDDDFGHSFARRAPVASDAPVKGYWVISVRILDEPRYFAYLEMASDAIDRLGGRMIIRSADGIVGAGTPKPRIVVVEFPSLHDATAAFRNVAQQAARLMFDGVAEYDITIVAGYLDDT